MNIDPWDHLFPPRTYIMVLAVLIVLTFLTVYAATFELGRWHLLVGMAIAVVKATLVIVYFMHVRFSSGLTRLVIGAAILWLLILITLTLNDYGTRSLSAIDASPSREGS